MGAPEWMIVGAREGFKFEVEVSRVYKGRGNVVQTMEQEQFIDTEWNRLQLQKVLEEGEVCHMNGMRTAKKKGPKKFRLVVNMRGVNAGVEPDIVRFDGMTALKDLMKVCGWAFAADMQDGYHHVVIHPDCRKWLGVEWKGQVRRFTRLPLEWALLQGYSPS